MSDQIFFSKVGSLIQYCMRLDLTPEFREGLLELLEENDLRLKDALPF